MAWRPLDRIRDPFPVRLMPALALATDYDGTLAQGGRVDEATLAALRRLKGSGRLLILVSGRELADLYQVFPELPLFDRVVAENGAILYQPESRRERVLATPPPASFMTRLRELGVGPISAGRIVVATWRPHEDAAREVIREMGLELEVILNKRAVMVLPRGVNKATGLTAALDELGLSPEVVVGVGDAENDLDFLRVCGCSVAVANALDTVKSCVHWVTSGDHGRGIVELIERMEAGFLPPSGIRP